MEWRLTLLFFPSVGCCCLSRGLSCHNGVWEMDLLWDTCTDSPPIKINLVRCHTSLAVQIGSLSPFPSVKTIFPTQVLAGCDKNHLISWMNALNAVTHTFQIWHYSLLSSETVLPFQTFLEIGTTELEVTVQ